MKFRAEEYFRAAIERMDQARTLYKRGDSYAYAMYSSGLAVECLLRAFRWEKEPSFEGRHDLYDLLKASNFLGVYQSHMRRQGMSEERIEEYSETLRAALNVVIAVWHNSLRFASETSARAFLNRINRVKGIKGNALKKNALDLVNAAQTVVSRGVALWTSKKK
jgi:HEPN domain-containing protein